MKAVRLSRVLWLVAAVFVIACFVSGAWLGNTLSALPPVVAPERPTTESADREELREKQRETAMVTAIASPAAVLIVFLTVLVVSGMFTGDSQERPG